MDQIEAAVLRNCLLRLRTRHLERRNGRTNDCSPRARELCSDERNALDIRVTVFAGESKFSGEFRADSFAEEEGGGAAALLVECDLEGAANCVFTAVCEAG